MFKLSENVVSAIGLIILVSFLFRYYLVDMVGVIGIVAIAFILFYFYTHLFESIVLKDFSVFSKNIQTHLILLVLLIFLIAATVIKSTDPRNFFRIAAIFLSMYLVIKLVLVEFYLRREVSEDDKRQEAIRKNLGK